MTISRAISVLLVEDEPILSMEAEGRLVDLGLSRVDTAFTLNDGILLATHGDHDFGIIDVGLRGEQSWPIAEILARRNVPFAFVTGDQYGEIGDRFPGVPVLRKPYEPSDFDHLVSFLVAKVPRLGPEETGGPGGDETGPSSDDGWQSHPIRSGGGPPVL